jgi:galactoside 2-L-fucosyltransferase 1/2
MAKIAFMFLVMTGLQHESMWKAFFANADPEKYTIYVHYKDSTDKNNTPDWLVKHKVRSVKTGWCDIGLLHAFLVMLKKAMKDKDNTYFSLISNTCIPLYTFDELYAMVFASKKSRITFTKGTVFENMNNIYSGHQWVTLNKTCADTLLDITKTSKGKDFIKYMNTLYKTNRKNDTWLGGCLDETVHINWFIKVYGSPSSKKFKAQITNTASTYTYWDFDKDPDHPRVFNLKDTKKFKNEIFNSGAFFARKFTPEAAAYIGKMQGITKTATKNPIVRKRFTDGLGNQMFQYASSMGIASMKNGKECFVNEDIDFETLDKFMVGPFTKCKKPKNSKLVEEKYYAKYDVDRYLVDGNIEIETDEDTGFLQSWKYFDSVESDVRKRFQFKKKIQSETDKLMKYMRKDGYKVVGVHIRRGDHIDLKYLRFPPASYFEKAMMYFTKKHKHVRFVVVSNDRDFSDKLFSKKMFSGYDISIASHTTSAPEDLSILASSDGVIMSLGTFSWWGGYLSGGPVTYYDKEFVVNHEVNKGKVNKADYYPTKWKALSS